MKGNVKERGTRCVHVIRVLDELPSILVPMDRPRSLTFRRLNGKKIETSRPR
jgi:hypothetical protein